MEGAKKFREAVERYGVKRGNILKDGRVLEHIYVPLGVIPESLLDLYRSEVSERI